jgi:hypothetical protein
METIEPTAGLAITYRVEAYEPLYDRYEDQGVAFRSPYGAQMYGRSLGTPWHIVDEFMPDGRRVTPTKFSTEDYKRGPTWTIPTTAPTVMVILPEWPGYGCGF